MSIKTVVSTQQRLFKVATVCVFTVIPLTSVIAQDSNDEATSLGAIKVSGEKIERSLQETTTSIQVFTSKDIADSGSIEDVYDVFEQSPNVTRRGEFGFSIRGIDVTGASAGSAFGPRTVDFNIDGVSQYTYGSREGLWSSWDIEQVEILKGPQSTTQGRNSLAGAVVVKYADPEFDANGAAEVTYSDDGATSLSLSQTGSLSDNLAFRLSANARQADGYIENDILGEDDFDSEDAYNLRGKLLYEFNNGGSALLTLSGAQFDDAGTRTVGGFEGADPFDRQSSVNTGGFFDTSAQAHSLNINMPINAQWSWQSITGVGTEEFDRASDFDGLSGNSEVFIDRDSDNVSQEFRLSFEGKRTNSVFGLFYTKGNGVEEIENERVSADALAGGLDVDFQSEQDEEFENIALFFNTDYELNNRLTLIAGARLDQEKRDNETVIDAQRVTDYSSNTDALVAFMIQSEQDLGGGLDLAAVTNETIALGAISSVGGGSVAAGTAGIGAGVNAAIDTQITAQGSGGAQDTGNDTNFLPKIGLSYQWNDKINTGLVYTKGYRPGGVSSNAALGTAQSFDAEFTDSVDLSFRSQWLQDRLTVNANVFYTQWKDQQVEIRGNQGNFDRVTENAGDSNMYGFELETKFQYSKALQLAASLGLLETEFKDFENGEEDFSGNEFAGAPNTTANVGMTYGYSTGYFVNGNVSYSSSFYTDNANDIEVGSRSVTNLKAGYQASQWQLHAFVNNLFDKDYLLDAFNDGITFEVGAPRVVGVQLGYQW